MLNGTSNYYWKVIGIAGALAGLVAWPGTGQATRPASAPATPMTFQYSNVFMMKASL